MTRDRQHPMRSFLRGLLPLIALVSVLPSAACGDDAAEPDADTIWVIEVSGEEFRVRVADEAGRASLARRLESRERGVVTGSLRRGDGGFNHQWSWHLDPATVRAVDAAIELCDGRPSMVEASLDYWTDTVGAFCPWGALVTRIE